MGKIAYGTTALLAVAVVVEIFHAPVFVIFALTSLALVGLVWVLGQATEALGHHAGPRVGGILNATFGNAAELIITIFAFSAGLTAVVKASIIGSIIGNVLLVLGASFLVGGLQNGTQKVSVTIAGANAGMLAIVAATLALPTIFVATEAQREGRRLPHHPEHRDGRGDDRPLRPVPHLLLPAPGGDGHGHRGRGLRPVRSAPRATRAPYSRPRPSRTSRRPSSGP